MSFDSMELEKKATVTVVKMRPVSMEENISYSACKSSTGN